MLKVRGSVLHFCLFYTVMLNLISHFVGLFHANLLVIQHLETLYLGGIHVRVVCERV